MSNFVIDLIGQKRIDRSPMPASLEAIYSDEEWNIFCDKIDRILDEIDNIKDGINGKHCCLSTFGVGAIALIYIFLVRNLILKYDMKSYQAVDIIVAVVTFFVLASILKILKESAISAAWRRVDGVLSNESKRKAGVSYHLKQRKEQEIEGRAYSIQINTSYIKYIVCQVANAPTVFALPMGSAEIFQDNHNFSGTPTSGTSTTPEFKEVQSAGIFNKSVKERLGELEDIKDMLSEREYEEKKVAILASL